MPHGSEKSPPKNRNEIRHSLCMPHCSNKLWRIIKKMTHKNLNIVKKLVYLSDIWIIDILTIKTCLKHRVAVFDDVKWFPWQESSEII